MRYVRKQLIGILAPVAAVLGLWFVATSDWGQNAAEAIGDLVVKLLTAMVNSA